jgi:hypothetical protein
VDELGRPDGTPPSIDIVGNWPPTLDSVAIVDHLGNSLDLSVVDTLTWNFWMGEGFPYECECDTVDKPSSFCRNATDPFDCQFRTWPDNGGSFDFYKKFSFSIQAFGHDNPKDPPPLATDPSGSGLKAWNYRVMNKQGQVVDLGKSVYGWFEIRDNSGDLVLNALDDKVGLTVFYPGPFTPEPDPMGDTVFENLPAWLDKEYTVIITARDTPVRAATEFRQTIWINGTERLINSFGDSTLGRRTQEKMFAFYIQLVR